MITKGHIDSSATFIQQRKILNSPADIELALKPLAPKPPSGSIVRKERVRKCYICCKVNCGQLFHQHNNVRRPRTIHTDAIGKQDPFLSDDTAFKASYGYLLAQTYVTHGIAASKTKPFYALPIPSELDITEMHRLFHELFTVEAIHYFTMTRPRVMPADLLFGPFMAPALCDKALCLSILALAAASQRPSDGANSKNIQALNLMGLAIEAIQEQISHSEEILSDITIAAACILWSANRYLDNAEALRQHAKNVASFVMARGGLHRLGMSGSLGRLITWADITTGLNLREGCYFPKPTEPISLKYFPPQRYGRFWLTSIKTSILDPAVVKGCQETARFIGILEQMEESEATGVTFFYVLQKLSVIMNQNSAFHASYKRTNTLNECISLALCLVKVKLFTFSRAQAGLIMVRYSTWLIQAIKGLGESPIWQDYVDLLIWLHFTILLAENCFEHSNWSLQYLDRSIN